MQLLMIVDLFVLLHMLLSVVELNDLRRLIIDVLSLVFKLKFLAMRIRLG